MYYTERTKRIELTVNTADYPAFRTYGHKATVKTTASNENYLVASLDVNFGSSILSFGEEAQKLREITDRHIEVSQLRVSGNTAEAWGTLEGEHLFYTIDLSPLIPKGWEFKAQLIGKHLRQLGVVAYAPGHEHDVAGVHVISNDDLRASDEPVCNDSYKGSWMKEPSLCQRPLNHLGMHQSISDRYASDWRDSGGASGSPQFPFGFICRCPFCGFVDAGSASGEKTCFSCSHWIMLEKDRDADSFIIGRQHYRPGAGGFGGQKFKVRRKDGTTWEGELMTQGEIPPWMADRFPENACFVVEKRAISEESAPKWSELEAGGVSKTYTTSLYDIQQIAWEELRNMDKEAGIR